MIDCKFKNVNTSLDGTNIPYLYQISYNIWKETINLNLNIKKREICVKITLFFQITFFRREQIEEIGTELEQFWV